MINMIKADLYRIPKSIGIYIAVILTIVTSVISIYMTEPGYIGNTQVSMSEEDAEIINDAAESGIIEAIENFKTNRDAQQKKGFVREVLGANIKAF